MMSFLLQAGNHGKPVLWNLLVPPSLDEQARIVAKRKTLKNKFVKHIVNWLTEYDKLTEEKNDVEEAWVYPALQVVFTSGYFKLFSERPMTVQNLDAILQKLDSTITSSFFRYFATEKSVSYTHLTLPTILLV